MVAARMNEPHRSTSSRRIVTGLATCLALGCSDGETLAPSDLPTGTVELHWTLGGEEDASQCERFGAEALHATLFDAGYVVEQFLAPCDELSATVELFVDDYALAMTLVDQGGFRVTERAITISFVLDAGETERIDVDFPARTFFNDSGAGGEGGQPEEPGNAAGAAGAEGELAGAGAGGSAGAAGAGGSPAD